MSEHPTPEEKRSVLPALDALQDIGGVPALPYYLMSTGQDKASTLGLEVLRGFTQKSVGGGAAPQWLLDYSAQSGPGRKVTGKVSGIKFAVLPVGWVGEWHESPKPQWVITLSGRWFLETNDGKRAEMGPGDLHLGLDQGTAGGKGHRSGQLGDEPCVQMLVQFEGQNGDG